ncbi:leucine-rich repeat extensin-like protein 1 [Cucurbita maxima]|uniref:Leucine-rich repeat extensin-like protein 1 n=1 Tax=Cucurbita maxima TaxID=3661 RepID=A0A6J1IUS7_CUCMA|nr:leucine-rich repeat extensin-like protein 1 [Cucurbita maxima]
MPFQGKMRFSTSLGLCVMAAALFLPPSDAQLPVPSTEQLCISQCVTCPVVCTTPTPTPTPRSYSSYIPSPPPPPPAFYGGYMGPPPALTSSYFFRGPPPPVANYVSGAQPSGQMPQTVGPRDYSYPYYYFYSSNLGSFASPSTFILLFACFFHVVF